MKRLTPAMTPAMTIAGSLLMAARIDGRTIWHGKDASKKEE